MRNSKKTQALADNCAKAHGFFCASYRGCSEEELIYVPLCSNSEKNPHVPSFVLITKEGVQYVQGLEYIDVLDGVRLRAFRRGREIYNSLYRKFQEKNFDCDEDNSEEIEEYSIVVSQMIKPKPWIAAHILYDYLEVAARLEMKVCLYPNKERIDGNQNWIYHVELI